MGRPKYLLDHLILEHKRLWREIEDLVVVNAHGCRTIVKASIQIRLQGYLKPVTVSIPRVVYALTHPGQPVPFSQEVVHMCVTTETTANIRVCITPDHLALDVADGRLALRSVRKRQLIREDL